MTKPETTWEQGLVAQRILDEVFRGYFDILPAGVYSKARKAVTEALALAEQQGAERERRAAADYVYAQLGDDAGEVADDIREGLHLGGEDE